MNMNTNVNTNTTKEIDTFSIEYVRLLTQECFDKEVIEDIKKKIIASAKEGKSSCEVDLAYGNKIMDYFTKKGFTVRAEKINVIKDGEINRFGYYNICW